MRARAGQAPLSAEVFLCRVSHIFPLLAVALVVWLVALMTFSAGGGALLPVVAALLVRTRHPGLEKEHAEKNKSVFLQDFPWVLNATNFRLVIVETSNFIVSYHSSLIIYMYNSTVFLSVALLILWCLMCCMCMHTVQLRSTFPPLLLPEGVLVLWLCVL